MTPDETDATLLREVRRHTQLLREVVAPIVVLRISEPQCSIARDCS